MPSAEGWEELGIPDSHSTPSSHTCDVRGHGALPSQTQPAPWGHSARSSWRGFQGYGCPLGGGCQGGDLSAHMADSEAIREQMSIPDSTSPP